MKIIRPSRIFRTIVRVFLFVFTLSLSAVGFLGGFSAVTILDPNSYNVNVPDGDITANLTITNPSSMYIDLPFNITNAGVYDLTNIEISLQVSMTYGNTLLPGNASTTVKIVDISQFYGTVAHGGFLKTSLHANATEGFILANFPPLLNIDWYSSPKLQFHGNLSFSASYSLNLYTFKTTIINYLIYELP